MTVRLVARSGDNRDFVASIEPDNGDASTAIDLNSTETKSGLLQIVDLPQF